MKTLRERVRAALNGPPKKSQAALARACGIAPPSVNDWLSGKTQSIEGENLLNAAAFLGVNPTWLASGKGPMRTGAEAPNTREGPKLIGLVPRISTVQAGEWSEIVDNFQPGDAAEWLPCPVKHGPLTYCLIVEGESMHNPGSKPSYDQGDVIFVDPDVTVQPGDRVVVRLEAQRAATFKQYQEEDGRKLLKALNPEWKPRYIEINGDATICGVVIGKWVSG